MPSNTSKYTINSYNDDTLFYFVRLRFCVNRSVPNLLEHYYYSAVTPHALRARVVIVYFEVYILVLVPVRAHKIRGTCFYLFSGRALTPSKGH